MHQERLSLTSQGVTWPRVVSGKEKGQSCLGLSWVEHLWLLQGTWKSSEDLTLGQLTERSELVTKKGEKKEKTSLPPAESLNFPLWQSNKLIKNIFFPQLSKKTLITFCRKVKKCDFVLKGNPYGVMCVLNNKNHFLTEGNDNHFIEKICLVFIITLSKLNISIIQVI